MFLSTPGAILVPLASGGFELVSKTSVASDRSLSKLSRVGTATSRHKGYQDDALKHFPMYAEDCDRTYSYLQRTYDVE